MVETMNIEQKAKAYDEALERAKSWHTDAQIDFKKSLETLFPELAESENEKIRGAIIDHLKDNNLTEWAAWLEKQGKETSWKPSKEEMDVLYGLAYITNQYDEHKEEVITRLYQDLKREFFNGSSYENMFLTNTSTEDDVRRRSTIQVLEYARSLDAYNQFGKADIDKNIAWLEKQGTPARLSEEEQNRFAKGVLTSCALSFINYLDAHKYEGKMCVSNGECEDIENAFHNAMWDKLHRYYCKYIEKQEEQKPVDKVEPKFHIGDWVVDEDDNNIYQIENVIENVTNGKFSYDLVGGGYFPSTKKNYHLWSIEDAKDGDVLVASDDSVFIYAGSTDRHAQFYIALSKYGDFNTEGGNWEDKNCVKPATKEQRDLLFQKMKEAGYTFDFEKKELKKISNALEECEIEQVEHDKYYYCIKDYYSGGCKRVSKGEVVQALRGMSMMALGVRANEYFIPVKRIVDVRPTWSEEDKRILNLIIQDYEAASKSFCGHKGKLDWLKSIKQRIGE